MLLEFSLVYISLYVIHVFTHITSLDFCEIMHTYLFWFKHIFKGLCFLLQERHLTNFSFKPSYEKRYQQNVKRQYMLMFSQTYLYISICYNMSTKC